MANIITVHGTNAGHPDDEGDKWWQRGSPFLRAVQSYIGEQIDITPLHWSGANSEVARRKTGAAIDRMITASKEPPIIMGHSHGGSSSVHALFLRHHRQPSAKLDKVRGFVSIGMPMIRFRSKRNPLTWFDLTGRLLLLSIMGILSVFFLSRFDSFREDPLRLIQGDSFGVFSLLPPMELIFAGVAFFIFGWFAWLNFKRQHIFSRNILARILGERHVALNHNDDEAINALSEGLKVKPKMIRGGSMFVNIFSMAALVLVLNIYGHLTGNELASRAIRADLPGNIGAVSSVMTSVGPLAFRADYLEIDAVRRYFMRRIEIRQPLKKVSLADVIARAEGSEIDNSWFGRHYAGLGDVVDFYVSEDDEDQLPMRLADAIASRFGEGSDALSDETYFDDQPDSYVVGPVLAKVAPIYTYAPPPAGVLVVGGGEAFMTPGTALYIPINAIMDLKWICADQRPDGVSTVLDVSDAFVVPSELSPGACDALNLGKWSVTDYFAVWGHGAYKGLLNVFTDNLGFLKQMGLGELDIRVFVDNIARLVPIFIIAILFSTVGMIAATPAANSFLVGTVKGAAYGNDGYGERPADVAPALDFSLETVGTLPENVQAEMTANSEVDAPAAINRFRRLLSSGQLINGATDADALSIAMQFDKSELLHNAYFHSELFQKYVASVLVERFGLRPNEAYRADPEIKHFARLINGEVG